MTAWICGRLAQGERLAETACTIQSLAKAGKSLPVFWPLFPLYTTDFFPVVWHFFCKFLTEQVLYYRILGLYYGLASTTLPLYAKPRAKVKGGCLSCEFPR